MGAYPQKILTGGLKFTGGHSVKISQKSWVSCTFSIAPQIDLGQSPLHVPSRGSDPEA